MPQPLALQRAVLLPVKAPEVFDSGRHLNRVIVLVQLIQSIANRLKRIRTLELRKRNLLTSVPSIWPERLQ